MKRNFPNWMILEEYTEMESSGNGQSLLDVVLRFFQEDQWIHQKLENKPVIRAGFHGERGTWVCYARVDEKSQCFLFHSLMGMNIPQPYRLNVLEYLSRVNYGLPVGNFDMNLDTGDVRFRTSIETPDGELTVPIVRAMVYTNVHTMDHYFPGVVAVVHGGLSPEAALARVETQMMENAPG